MADEPGRRLMLARGDQVCVEARELEAAALRPGAVARIERGEYGFELVIFCEAADRPGFYRGAVRDVWGQVPCA